MLQKTIFIFTILLISILDINANTQKDTTVINFTQEEQKWIAKKTPITYVYDVDWAPFEWNNEVNRHSGIIADILTLISKKSNVKFIPIHTENWAKAVLLAENKKVDMYSAIPLDEKRGQYMNFTQNDIFNYNASLVKHKDDQTNYDDLNEVLPNKTIAIVKSSSLGNFVKNKYPNAKYIEVEKTLNGFEKLDLGEIDLFAINSATADYMITIKGFNDLEIASKLDYQFKLKIAISKEMPKEVISIIDKTLSSIDKSEIDQIYNSWMKPIIIHKETDWEIVVYILILTFVLVAFLLYRQYLLKNQTENFETFFENSPDGISILKDNKFIMCNQKIIDILKFNSKEDLLNTHPSKVSPKFQPDGRESFEKAEEMMALAVKNQGHQFEWMHVRSNSEEFWAEITLTPMVLNNEDVIHVIWRDISEKKRNEEIITNQTKMAALGEMIANISHQWRQPLSVISTGASGMIIQKEIGELTDESLIKTCDLIDDNAQYLSQTIDDFRDYIKGDSKKVEFDINDNINSFLHLVEGTIKSNQINILKDIQSGIKITSYPNELIQCYINIFNNAKDALSKVEYERYLFISVHMKEDKVFIVFKDNAGGIDESILPKIFEPYFTTKHRAQGTGLGLHMTYNLICDGIHGTIEARNTSYEYNHQKYTGAEFIIQLPID